MPTFFYTNTGEKLKRQKFTAFNRVPTPQDIKFNYFQGLPRPYFIKLKDPTQLGLRQGLRLIIFIYSLIYIFIYIKKIYIYIK